MRHLLVVLISFTSAACLAPVAEAQCLRDLDCDAGRCVDGACRAGSTGGGGGATGGGIATGGGSATGGGVATGGGTTTGGGAGGGSVVGGGAGGGSACAGCNSAIGCQPGNEVFACGAAGAQCQTCGFGEQCVNGACITATCGPMTCNGCCTNGFCVTATNQSAFTCGLGGGMCTNCGQGRSCVMGQCVTTPACGAASCPDGCCFNGNCVGGDSRFACGTAGAQCATCTQGQQCTNGACTTPPACGPMTCMGCCDNGQCTAGTTRFTCGAGGAVCQRCQAGANCVNGQCSNNTTVDAGVTVPAGSPCTTTQQCQPPFGAMCIQENIAGQATGYPGGYCSSTCGVGTACSGGAVCITEPFFGAAQSTCRAACTTPGQQGSCRTGYVCHPSPNSTTPGFCRARCTNGGALSGCAAGQTCNMTTGVCN